MIDRCQNTADRSRSPPPLPHTLYFNIYLTVTFHLPHIRFFFSTFNELWKNLLGVKQPSLSYLSCDSSQVTSISGFLFPHCSAVCDFPPIPLPDCHIFLFLHEWAAVTHVSKFQWQSCSKFRNWNYRRLRFTTVEHINSFENWQKVNSVTYLPNTSCVS